VADSLLLKPGRLVAAGYQLVKSHAGLGAHIASGVLSDEHTAWLRGHHERFDGAGYPDGPAGEEIPDGARLLALADSWDVMDILTEQAFERTLRVFATSSPPATATRCASSAPLAPYSHCAVNAAPTIARQK
jgi:HD domain